MPPSLPSLIASVRSLSAAGHLSVAFSFLSLLRLLSPSSSLLPHPLSSLLSSSTNLKLPSQGKQLHSLILSLGLLSDPFLTSRLTAFYSSIGHFSDAHSVVEQSPTKSALPWNLLISAYTKNGLWRNAILAYEQMVARHSIVDKFTYTTILKACGETLDLELGREIHRSAESSGVELDLFVQNALASMYAKCGDLDVARRVFDEMPERDVVSWNAMISGYLSKGMWEEGYVLLDRMQVEVELNTVTCNAILSGNFRMGNYLEALRLVVYMRSTGLGVDDVTLVVGLNSVSRIEALSWGKEIHGLAIRIHLDGIENVNNALITMYSRCKHMKLAYILFRTSVARSLITWNAMIAGFAMKNQAEEASLIFRYMVRVGVVPNYVTIVTIISLSARVANLQQGRELHCYIIKHVFEGCGLLWNSLVDMYSKAGRMRVARRVFNMMSHHDVVSYTSLILGYGMQGEGMAALKLFKEMISCGIEPDSIVMVAVLSACSHSKLVSEGQELFKTMVLRYGIVPQMEHYSCMIDLFGRAGLLEKAEKLLEGMPFQPSTSMLATLVGACRTHGNIEFGEWAAKRLLEMRSDDPSHYSLVASMYAYTKNWQELARVKALMRDIGIAEAPTCSWVDLGNESCPFLVHERSNLHEYEIYVLLEGFDEHMRHVGYISNEELGFAEEVG